MESLALDSEQRAALITGIKAAIADQNKGLTDDITKLGGRLHEVEQRFASIGGGGGVRVLSGPWSGPDPFATDEFKTRLRLLTDGHKTTGKIPLNLSVKALVSIGDNNSSPAGGFPTAAQRGPIVPQIVRPLSLFSLLTSVPVSSNAYEFVRLSKTGSAAVQADEGDQKAEADFDASPQVARIGTVAVTTIVSQQVIADNPQLLTIVRGSLLADLLVVGENLSLLGDGTDSDIVLGLIPQATSIPVTQATGPDRISYALSVMQAAGYSPSAILMAPGDVHDIRTSKGTGDGQYLTSGAFVNAGPPTLWSIPLVASAALPEGTALILDTSRILLLDRMQPTIAISTEDRDNFVKNMATILCEMRIGLAVLDTGAVRSVELPAAGTT